MNNFHKLYKHTSEAMYEIESGTVHLVLTSPPYNVNMPYDDALPWDKYREKMETIFNECYRILCDGGRLVINIANLGRYKNGKPNINDTKYYKPLSYFYWLLLTQIGFEMKGEIIWYKGRSANQSMAVGSYRSSQNPTLQDVHEYLLVFFKPDANKMKKSIPVPPKVDRINMEKDEFMNLNKSVWEIQTANNSSHPCPFPIELAKRVIRYYTYPSQIVVDPFAGSGTTMKAAKQLERSSIMYEIEEEYQLLIENIVEQTDIFFWFDNLSTPGMN